MPSDTMNSWALIQQGVRDTERLIGQKQYNLSMLKARQTLEYMVKHLAKRNGIPDGDLMDTIDELYRSNVISKSTCEHYHKIRVIGNKAAHDEDNNAYNANTAYHLLSQEILVFSNDISARRRTRSQSSQVSSRPESRKNAAPEFSAYMLLKILIPVLAVILIIALIRLIHPGNKKAAVTTAAAESTATVTVTTAVPSTTPAAMETTKAAVYKTTSSLNVRSAPSKDGDKLTTLAAGTVVDYVKAYNDEWAVINYNGGQAYVASKFLISETAAGTETTASSGQKPAAETTAAGKKTVSGTTAAGQKPAATTKATHN